ncbi:DUF1793-domain-containing protein [Trametes meyenii]|nr:DUF1793-domain-containing protein [Trametes meyenii]
MVRSTSSTRGLLPILLSAVSLLPSLAIGQGASNWTATPFNPSSVPLAVRSPYLSAWLNQGAGTALNDAWPVFWTGSILGWAGFVKVDGTAYSWLGVPGVPKVNFTKATQKSFEFTSTQSNFGMNAGPVDLNITFLSPVEPGDLVNQSLPFSYLAVSAASNDGQDHSVQVYVDISAEWISGDNNLEAEWVTDVGDMITHQVHLASEEMFTETNDRAQYGTAYHSTLNDAGVTWQTGQDIMVRAQFINHGVLLNSQDTNYRPVSNNWPVFALAHDLGKVNSASAPAVFSVGHVRDPVVQYILANNEMQQRTSVFWSRFSIINSAISVFLKDYSNALERAKLFDAQVQSDASKVSDDYAALVAISVRQVFGATELTLSRTGSGDYNTSDVQMYMKELSTGGTVNTADLIFPAWPLFLYMNPALGKQLLLPLLQYQATGQYPNAWAAHDVGVHYPNATGHNDGGDTHMPIEESGNMLIMVLSYTQRTNDTSLIRDYFDLLDKWGSFLVQNTLFPGKQLSTDAFAGQLENQTNLAIKGIIGIKAMSEIAALAGDSEKSTDYNSTALQFAQKWQKLAMSSDGTHLTLAVDSPLVHHATAQTDASHSWGIAYNLYADRLLGLNLIPNSVYDLQTKWYSDHFNDFGIPLDTRHTYSKSDWQLWTAAVVTNNTVRDRLINSVRKYAADDNSSQPFADWYETLDGRPMSTRARPVVGGHLAISASAIAPSSPLPSSSLTPGSSTTSSGETQTSSSGSAPPSTGKPNSGSARFCNVISPGWVLASGMGAVMLPALMPV